MNFYHARYKRQRYYEEGKVWIDTYYDNQGIIVIADNYNEAYMKIDKCLAKVESGNYRAVLVGDITECIGLDRRYGFERSLEINPILNN